MSTSLKTLIVTAALALSVGGCTGADSTGVSPSGSNGLGGAGGLSDAPSVTRNDNSAGIGSGGAMPGGSTTAGASSASGK